MEGIVNGQPQAFVNQPTVNDGQIFEQYITRTAFQKQFEQIKLLLSGVELSERFAKEAKLSSNTAHRIYTLQRDWSNAE